MAYTVRNFHSRAMDWIPTEKFLELWDRLKVMEHKTDFALANQIGIARSRLNKYRSGESKAVNPHVLAMIENRLGYEIGFDGENWKIERRDELSKPQPFGRSDEGALSREDEELLREIRFSATHLSPDAKRLMVEFVRRLRAAGEDVDAETYLKILDIVLKKK